jgi:nitrate/nitrite-specific signal transduction histidine kinase
MSSFLNKNIRYLLIFPLFISLFSHSLFAIDIKNIYEAVDIAGKQRMFTQRMLKDYAMIGMKNSFGNPDKDLKTIMSEFEDHLHALHDYTKNDEIKKSAKKVEALWIPIKKVLESPPSKDEVGKLQEDLELLLSAANDTTALFAKETGKDSGKVVDMSGRQRMLSQRMASLYMLKVWGVDDDKFKEKMKDSMELFKTSLTELQESEFNTDEINGLLNDVEKSFMFFEVMNKSSNVFIPSLIYKKSNDILKNMNKATQCYVDECK